MGWTYLTLLHSLILLKLIQAQSCPGTQTQTGCYVIREDKQTWSGATRECQKIANTMKRPGFGHLASITDDPQYNLVKGLLNDLIKKQTTFSAISNIRQVWLGGYEESMARGNSPIPNWRWIDNNLGPLNYQGCFVEDPKKPEFSYSKSFTKVFSPELCINHCYEKGFSIAATRKGDTCSCGNSYKGKDGTSDSCNTPCLGGYTMCGGASSHQIYVINGSFSDWNYNQPNNFENYQACGHIERQHIQSNLYVMGDKFCREFHAYACSVPQAMCDNNVPFAYKAGSKCAYYEIYGKVNWFKARENCRKKGGDLITITDKETMKDMTDYIVGTLRFTDPLWVGLIGIKWFWDDDKEFVFSDFPSANPANKDYNCLRLVSNQQKVYSWEDFDCTVPLAYLCFVDTVTPLPSTTTKSTTTKSTTTTKAPKLNAKTTTSSKMTTSSGDDAQVTLSTISAVFDNATTGNFTTSDILSTLSPTSPSAGASTNNDDNNMTIYILIGVIATVLVLAVIVGVILHKCKKKNADFQTSHVHPDKEAPVLSARPPETDRSTILRRGTDEASTITTTNIKATMEPLPDLMRPNLGGVHESRFKLDPIGQDMGEEKKKKDKKHKKKKDREALGEDGVDTERRRKKKKSKRSSFETEEVRSSAGYTNTVVDMSHEEHYNY